MYLASEEMTNRDYIQIKKCILSCLLWENELCGIIEFWNWNRLVDKNWICCMRMRVCRIQATNNTALDLPIIKFHFSRRIIVFSRCEKTIILWEKLSKLNEIKFFSTWWFIDRNWRCIYLSEVDKRGSTALKIRRMLKKSVHFLVSLKADDENWRNIVILVW